MSSIGIEFPKEIQRCTELAAVYDALPEGAGRFGATMIRATISSAQAAWESQDLPAIVRAFAALKECE